MKVKADLILHYSDGAGKELAVTSLHIHFVPRQYVE